MFLVTCEMLLPPPAKGPQKTVLVTSSDLSESPPQPNISREGVSAHSMKWTSLFASLMKHRIVCEPIKVLH